MKNKKVNKLGAAFMRFDEGGALLMLIAMCLLVGVINPMFFSAKNVINVLRQFSYIGIVAVGGTFVLITGGIDLSVGSLMGFGAVGCAWMCANGVEPILAVFIMLVAGGLLGALQGYTAVKLKLNPFIVTLGGQYIIKGMTLLISGGLPVRFDNYMNWLGSQWLTIPVSIYVMLIIMIVGHIVLSKTDYGRKIYAVGGNSRAAKLSGIKVGKIQISVFATTGVLASLAGMMTCANLNSGDVSTGTSMEMNVITACVLGGASLNGGKGSILGTFIGAAIIGVIRNGFVLLRIPAAWQTIALGGFLVLACAVDTLKRKER